MLNLESYLIAEEGLFSKLKEKRNAEKAAKMELWLKEKFKIKKIVEDVVNHNKKKYPKLKVVYTFDIDKLGFYDDDMFQISDSRCTDIWLEYTKINIRFDDDMWLDYLKDVVKDIREEIAKKIESKVWVSEYDDCIINVSLIL